MEYLGYSIDLKIASHVITALVGIFLGISILLLKKGNAKHKFLGRIWVVLVGFVSIGAFWIRTLNPEGFLGMSVAHITSVLTLFFLILGIVAIRYEKRGLHEFCMKFVFYGGLLLAGSMTLMPGRLLPYYIFGM